jgi:predicted branched-subunit amino acid permease
VVGLDFAVTALFLVLGMEAYKVKRSLPAPVLALGCALVAALISRQNMLVIAMGLFTVTLVCSYFFTARRRKNA